MELRQLRYFVEVAKLGHYGRAAQKLSVAQPALSRAIQSLERELGFPLFQRLPRRINLSSAGERYLSDVERIFGELDRAAKAAKEAAHAEVLRIGQAPMLAMEKEAEAILSDFLAEHHGIRINLKALSSHDQLQALMDHEIDIGLGHVFGSLPGDVRALRVTDNPYCTAIVGLSNPCSRNGRLQLSDIESEPLLLFRRERNPRLFDHLVSRLRHRGFKGEVVQNAEYGMWNWKIMPRHRGWVLSNKSALSMNMRDAICIPIADVSIPFGIDVLWNKRNSAGAVGAFLGSLRNPMKAVGATDESKSKRAVKVRRAT